MTVQLRDGIGDRWQCAKINILVHAGFPIRSRTMTRKLYQGARRAWTDQFQTKKLSPPFHNHHARWIRLQLFLTCDFYQSQTSLGQTSQNRVKVFVSRKQKTWGRKILDQFLYLPKTVNIRSTLCEPFRSSCQPSVVESSATCRLSAQRPTQRPVGNNREKCYNVGQLPTPSSPCGRAVIEYTSIDAFFIAIWSAVCTASIVLHLALFRTHFAAQSV